MKLVELARQVNPLFKYPVDISEIEYGVSKRIRLAGFECRVNVEFENEENEVTSDQIRHLERLAQQFAYSNKKR